MRHKPTRDEPRKNKILQIRISSGEFENLKKIAEGVELGVSQFIRLLILNVREGKISLSLK